MDGLSKKQQTLLWLERAPKALFQCIHCRKELHLSEDGSLKCQNNHTFNLAKQGYYFLSQTSSEDHYDRQLFEARHRIICDSPFYHPLHQTLKPLMAKARIILDAGSGEGSHLAHLIKENQCGLAFDLSKSGVQLATKYNGRQFNGVADLTQLPLKDQSVDVILSLLSPSNYEEFQRVGKQLIKVIPNEGYLKEIRQAMYQMGWLETKDYSHEDVLSVFKRHYNSYQSISVRETVTLTLEQLEDLVTMTPLTWQLTLTQKKQLMATLLENKQMTLDVTILVTQ